MGSDENSSLLSTLMICLIGAASAAAVVTIYHCISAGHIRNILRLSYRISTPRQFHPPRIFVGATTQSDNHQNSMENSVAELIPAHKYQKGEGLIEEDDGMCTVCLSEFEEGEELRTLPECMHSFHAPCIDMWLYSHSNCPICRTNTMSSPRVLMQLLESNLGNSPNDIQNLNIQMSQIYVV